MTFCRRTFFVFAALLTVPHLAFSQGKEIPVGVFNSLTGTWAYGGVPIQNGMKLALEEANAAGLPGGNRFKIVEADTAGEKSQALSLVNQFIKRDNVQLILGPTTSGEALAAAPEINEHKTPILAVGTLPAIVATGPWAFKFQATPTDMMSHLGKLAVEKHGVKRILTIIDQSNDGFVLQKDALVSYLKAAGTTIVAEERFFGNEGNFLAMATKAASTPVDAIFVAASAEAGANIITQLRQAGLDPKVKIFGPSTFGSLSFVKIGGKAVEGTFLISDYSPTSNSPQNQAFVKAYLAKYKSVPDNWAGVGYSLATVAIQAVRNVGPNPDRQKIRDELAKLKKVPVVLGEGTWGLDDKRMPVYSGVLLQVKDGKYATVQ